MIEPNADVPPMQSVAVPENPPPYPNEMVFVVSHRIKIPLAMLFISGVELVPNDPDLVDLQSIKVPSAICPNDRPTPDPETKHPIYVPEAKPL